MTQLRTRQASAIDKSTYFKSVSPGKFMQACMTKYHFEGKELLPFYSYTNQELQERVIENRIMRKLNKKASVSVRKRNLTRSTLLTKAEPKAEENPEFTVGQ
jgi:hypothetical protein